MTRARPEAAPGTATAPGAPAHGARASRRAACTARLAGAAALALGVLASGAGVAGTPGGTASAAGALGDAAGGARAPGEAARALPPVATPPLVAEASDGSVPVVLARDLLPYRRTVDGIQATLGRATEVILLGSERAAEAAPEKSPRVVLAIGKDALRHCLARYPRAVVVFTMVVNPEGFMRSAPGRVTGVSMHAPPELQLDTLRELWPRARRVGFVYSPAASAHLVEPLREAARARGMELAARPASEAGAALRAVDALVSDVDAFVAPADPIVAASSVRQALLLAQLRRGIPIVGYSDLAAEEGFLFGFALDPVEHGRQAGELARTVLDGPAGALAPPVAAARAQTLVVNRNSARRIGAKVPASWAAPRVRFLDTGEPPAEGTP